MVIFLLRSSTHQFYKRIWSTEPGSKYRVAFGACKAQCFESDQKTKRLEKNT